MKKREIIEIAGSATVIAAILAALVIFGGGEVSVNNEWAWNELYAEIGNLSTVKSTCEQGSSEKDVFFERFWKTARQNNIETADIWSDYLLLNGVYQEAKDEYQTHAEKCECLNDVTDFQNKEYTGKLRSGVPACVFGFLPEVPYNLRTISSSLEDSWDVQISCNLLGEEYWKQPEFYKNQDSLLNYYLDKPFGFTAPNIAGYSDELVASIPAGGAFSACVFVSSQAGMSSFAAVPLDTIVYGGEGTSPKLENNFFSDGNRTTGSEDMSRYFEIEISPDLFVFEPSYPMFHQNWTQKVKLNVKSLKNTPKGRYMIILGPFGTLDKELDEYLSIEYGVRYQNMGGMYSELLKIGVEVR